MPFANSQGNKPGVKEEDDNVTVDGEQEDEMKDEEEIKDEDIKDEEMKGEEPEETPAGMLASRVRDVSALVENPVSGRKRSVVVSGSVAITGPTDKPKVKGKIRCRRCGELNLMNANFCNCCFLILQSVDSPFMMQWKNSRDELNKDMKYRWRLAARGLPSRNSHTSKLAKQHYKNAREAGYKSCIERYECNTLYQEACDEAGYTEQDLLYFEYKGNPANRYEVGMPYEQRVNLYGHWSYNAEGTGSRNRGEHPSTVSHGGSGGTRREHYSRPYNANAQARAENTHWDWSRSGWGSWGSRWSGGSSSSSSAWRGRDWW